MVGSFRRWRPLIAIVAVWLFVSWYLFADETIGASGNAFASRPAKYHKHKGSSTGPHWSKLPERYPVSSLLPIPTDKPATRIPSIQKNPTPEEDQEARRVRQDRLAQVKKSFEHSWKGYKEHAWLRDEVTPLTGKAKDPFGGWAATLVDALDTLWIMGLKNEFKQAVEACEEIDFTQSEEVHINVFETTIRYLGGFLAAYELSGKQYPVLLKKAVEVGDLLMCAFDTPNRMPISRWDWKTYMQNTPQKAPNSVLISEIGSLSLEFTKLSQLTGDLKYYDATQRISDEFEKSQQKTLLPGMWGIVVNTALPAFDIHNDFTLGGMSDSLYEYFPKQYLILGGALQQPRKMYEAFIDVAKKHLFRRVLNEHNIPLIISGDAHVTGSADDRNIVVTTKGQHLTCFTGGMVGIGSRIFNRPDDLEIAKQLTDGCVWSYNMTKSGIGPEVFTFASCGSIEESQTGEKCKYDRKLWHDQLRTHWHPGSGDSANKVTDDEVETIIKRKRLAPGVLEMNDKRYILRPEAIESVFMMWRITGDPTWQEKAWAMWTAVEKHTRSPIAAASLEDITFDDPTQVDSMESFWLAETLKYFYLVFAEFDVIDLDQWVLNTEAHPLKRGDA